MQYIWRILAGAITAIACYVLVLWFAASHLDLQVITEGSTLSETYFVIAVATAGVAWYTRKPRVAVIMTLIAVLASIPGINLMTEHMQVILFQLVMAVPAGALGLWVTYLEFE